MSMFLRALSDASADLAGCSDPAQNEEDESPCRHKLPISDVKEFCGREDARLVISHLDKVLPEGSLTAKYRLAAGSAEEAVQLYNHALNVRVDFKVLDVSLRECARIIAANCLHRAQAVDKVCHDLM